MVGAPNYLPFGTGGWIYSDNYYTNMDADIYNEILSGRLTVHNTTEAQTVVNKILLYEKNPTVDASDWFIDACLIVREGYDHDDSIYWSDINRIALAEIANAVKVKRIENRESFVFRDVSDACIIVFTKRFLFTMP